MVQAGIVTGDILCPALSFFARKSGLGLRMTEESSRPKLRNWGVRRRAASWETLCPVAMAVRNRVFISRSPWAGFVVNRGDCRRVRTFLRDHVGGAGGVGGLWIKNDARSSSQVLLLISTPKPYANGSLTATIALVTVAGETVGDEWKMEVAKPARVAGVMTVTPLVLTNDWNFLQPDSYWRRVEALWADIRSATVAPGRSERESAWLRKARRSSVRMS